MSTFRSAVIGYVTALAALGFILTLVAWTHSAHADPAKVASVTNFKGDCHRYDVDRASGVVPGRCGDVVDGLTFQDGYTSLQFHSLSSTGEDVLRVAFAGPRWTQVDDTHSSMVLEQLILAKQPTTKIDATSKSGFCLFRVKSKEEEHDNPVRIYCEYNDDKSTHIYILDNTIKLNTSRVQSK